MSGEPMSADSLTYGHEIIEEAPVTSRTVYTATSDGDVHEDDHDATPDQDSVMYRCACGDSFDTREKAIDHIETKARGITRERLKEISREAKGTTFYGFTCCGRMVHTDCIRWGHETLDLVVYATPGFRDSNAIDIAVRTRCGAEEVLNDTIPVDDVTELTPDRYKTIVDQWLLENLVSERERGETNGGRN